MFWTRCPELSAEQQPAALSLGACLHPARPRPGCSGWNWHNPAFLALRCLALHVPVPFLRGCLAETSLPTLGFPWGLPVYTEGRGTPCQDFHLSPCPRVAFLTPLWLLLAAPAPRAAASSCVTAEGSSGCRSVWAAAAPAPED